MLFDNEIAVVPGYTAMVLPLRRPETTCDEN
jgi:hypothetical protein